MEKEVTKKDRKDKTELFENTPVQEAVMKLSIPTVIGCLVMVIYNLADTFFVGKLNDSIQTSAVTLVGPVILAFNAVNNLFGTGTSSLISRSLGVKNYELVKKTSAFGTYMAIIAGAIFSIVVLLFKNPLLHILGADTTTLDATSDYIFWTVIMGAIPAILNVVMGFMIRAEGQSLHATIGTMSGCILNIILDPIFIFDGGLGMKAAGAGLATFISNMVACLYFFIFLIVKKNSTYICIQPSKFGFDKEVIKEVMSVGIPSAIQNLLNVTGMAILNKLAAGYDNDAVSAVGITHKIAMVPMYFSMGFGQGVMPLVGYNFSAGNKKRMRDAIMFSIEICGIFMIVAAALLWVFSSQITYSFMKDSDVVMYGAEFLKGFAIAQPFLAMDFLGVGIFQACGMGKTTFVFAVMRKVLLEIPALLILEKIFGVWGLAYAQLVAEIVLSLIAAVIMYRLVKPDSKNKA